MSATQVITRWNPEDAAFWRDEGQRVAARNLWLSTAALVLAFAVWMLWSVVVVYLPAAGFRFTTNQLFWLVALPALSGATLRMVYAFAVPAFGGRRFTALATASLLLPTLGLAWAVQDPATPYEAFVGLALLAGLGGGHFASTMAHVSLFFPQRTLGWALGLAAGLGNLGVPLAQALVPLAVGAALFGTFGSVGAPQALADGSLMWLQNAGWLWVPLIAASAIGCWFGLDDLTTMRGRFGEQAVVFTRRHNWLLSWLYLGGFGSFIGWAAAWPLLLQQQMPQADAPWWLWAGPLLGAVLRPAGGAMADRFGAARTTLWAFGLLLLATLVLLRALSLAAGAGAAAVMVPAALLLFGAAGVASSSVFKMIPLAYAAEHRRRAGPERAEPAGQGLARAAREAGATLGFASAVGAYGGFFIPKALGTAIAVATGPAPALALFALFYGSCIAITWWHYGRPGAATPC
jgi:NNP family nitrate/nitrite transporter-like MFS transporter